MSTPEEPRMHTDITNEAKTASELMHERGSRDGREGLNPSSTSADYWKGYAQGRRELIERTLRGY